MALLSKVANPYVLWGPMTHPNTVYEAALYCRLVSVAICTLRITGSSHFGQIYVLILVFSQHNFKLLFLTCTCVCVHFYQHKL